MLLTMKIKLLPDEEQKRILLETIERFNKACNFISETAWRYKIFGKVGLQKLLYREIRERFGLSAQMVVRAVGKVSESYHIDCKIKHAFKPRGAMVYDDRILSYKGLDQISILTLQRRLLVPIKLKEYRPLDRRRMRGQADLIYRNGTFYLMSVVDVPEKEEIIPEGVLGVDLGIMNLATTSDGVQYSGKKCIEIRKRFSARKARLQKAGTWDAKKHLKRISGRERRFKRDTNHCIAKTLVLTAKDTNRAVALEALKGIRSRITVGKAVRESIGKWAFYELTSFIQYKAKLAGIPVFFVDPAHTSQRCSECDFIDRRNRKTQAEFVCLKCGHSENADINAAKNIALRAAVNQPIALRPDRSYPEDGRANLRV